MAIQIPKQRIANEKFAKMNEKKLGKKKPTVKKQSPISKTWIFIILFLLVGGGILELMSYLF